MLDLKQARTRIYDNAVEAVDEWFRQQSMAPYAHFYLYHKPSGDTRWGRLAIAEDRPEGYELSSAERISPTWTREQALTRLVAISEHLPLLPTGPL